MVDSGLIRDKLEELSTFYKEVEKNSKEGWDLEKSQFGETEASVMIQLIDQSKGGLKNKDLKRLHAGFANLTHGIERFMDYDFEVKHREVTKDIYQIKKDLEQHIKW